MPSTRPPPPSPRSALPPGLHRRSFRGERRLAAGEGGIGRPKLSWRKTAGFRIRLDVYLQTRRMAALLKHGVGDQVARTGPHPHYKSAAAGAAGLARRGARRLGGTGRVEWRSTTRWVLANRTSAKPGGRMAVPRGPSVKEAAKCRLSSDTVKSDWRLAKLWSLGELDGAGR